MKPLNCIVDVTPYTRNPYSGVGITAARTVGELSKILPLTLVHRGKATTLDGPWTEKPIYFSLPLRIFGNSRSVLLTFDHTCPPFLCGKRVVVIHDCWTLRDNLWQDLKFQRRGKARLEKIINRADRFVTPTQSVKLELQKFVPSGKAIDVVSWGPFSNEAFIGESRDLTSQRPSNPLSSSDQPLKVLVVACIEARKNHRMLFKVLSDFPDLELILCGGLGYQGDQILQEFERARGSSRCRWTHLQGLSGAELESLYRSAFVVVLPSFEEGFGLPAIEAMAYGCPTILSDIGALREVGGDAALYIDPHDDGASLRSCLQFLLQNPSEWTRLSELGRKRAAQFSWAETARRLAPLLTEAR